MKICIIHNLYEPYARGGAEQVVKATIDFLLSLGHEVVLITATPEKEKIVEKKYMVQYPTEIRFRLMQYRIFQD